MRIRFIFRPEPSSTEVTLFGDVFVPRHSTWRPVFASAAAHGLAVALLPALVQALGTYDPPPEHKTYHLEMLHLRVPERVFLPSSRAAERAANTSEAPATDAPAPEAAGASSAAARPAAPGSPHQMELPVTRQSSENAPVILQPDSVLPPAPSVPPAPNMAFWNRTIPPPARRQAVIPGRVQQSPQSPSLTAPPVLTPSNAQPVSSDVAALLAANQVAPKLPVPNSSTNPIRMQGKGAGEIASFEMPQSDPVNLIYLLADKPSPKQIEIPKGLQNAPRGRTGAAGEGAGNSATLSSGDKPNAAAAAAGNRVPPRAGESAAAGTAHAAGTSPAPGTSAPVSAERPVSPGTANTALRDSAADTAVASTARPSAGTPAGSAAAPDADHPAAPPPKNDPGVIRVAHPVNGNFDVVILQSASRDDLPNVGATLSGNPVYTVYINVGDKREWLLEYCVPSSGSQRASAYQVNIDDTGAVAAPYPVATAIPGRILELQHSKHIALHALLSTSGEFHNVTAQDMEDPLVREVIPLLSQWKFRPALRDKVPVEVEILLIIPARS